MSLMTMIILTDQHYKHVEELLAQMYQLQWLLGVSFIELVQWSPDISKGLAFNGRGLWV